MSSDMSHVYDSSNSFKIAIGNIFTAAIGSHDWQPFKILMPLMKSKLFIASLSILNTFKTYN